MTTPNLFAFLQAQAPVAALVGDRIYPNRIPQHIPQRSRKMPAVVFKQLAGPRDYTFCGHDGLVGSSWLLSCYAPQYDDAQAVGTAVRDALMDFRGLMGETRVGPVQLQDEQDGEPEPEPGLERRDLTFTIWYQE